MREINSGSKCPNVGLESAAYTDLETQDGPGPMSNGSLMCANLLSIKNIFPSISNVDYWITVEK